MKKYLILCMASLIHYSATAQPIIIKPLPDGESICESSGEEPLYCVDDESIHIEYLNSNNPVANHTINQAINASLDEELAEQTNTNDGIPDDHDYYPALDRYIRENSTSYSAAGFITEIKELPKYCGLTQYDLRIEFYGGGPHPGEKNWQYVFAGNRQLTINDIINPNKIDEAERLAEDALFRYLEEIGKDNPVYERQGQLELSKYFYFTPEGLNLQYQTYEVLSGADGAPLLKMPYQWLNGILNPRYMPQNCQ